MKISLLKFCYIFFILTIITDISTAKEINITKTTTVVMNDDLSLNISTEYEAVNVIPLVIYTDEFPGSNNNSVFLGENPGILNLSFISIKPSKNSFKYLETTSNKYDDIEYTLDYEVQIKSKNSSYFPYVPPTFSDETHFQYARTNDTLVLYYKLNLSENVQMMTFPIFFFKKDFEVAESNTIIKINNDESLAEISDINLKPIVLDEEIKVYFIPIDLGNKFDSNLKVEDAYFIVNNVKLYPTKYMDLSEMWQFLELNLNNSGVFTGYYIKEMKNKKFLMLIFISKVYTSFGLHYMLTGITQNKIIKDSNNVFTKEVNIPQQFNFQSPNTLYAIEVEIPEGDFIDESSVNYRKFLSSNPNINRKSITWQFKNYEVEPLVPFKFSYSKETKNLADILFKFNMLFLSVLFLLVLLLFFKFIALKQKTVIEIALFFFANILIPLIFGKATELKTIFLYSMAYLPISMIILITALYYHKEIVGKMPKLIH